MAPQLAWIGLGNMGRGMCRNLVAKGNLDKPLIIYNRTQKRAIDFQSELTSEKSTVASSVEEAVSNADFIFTCLGDDSAITDTIATALKGNVHRKLFVDCSTVHPDTTSMLAKTIEGQGAEFVACPVFGAPAMADAGQLLCVPAGPASAVAKVIPYCKGVIGRANIDFSNRPQGRATLLKLVGNTFVLNMVESLAEAHTLADKSGLGSNDLHQFIELMLPGVFAAYSARFIAGDYYKRDEPLFAVDLARKDARHAMELADSAGTKLKGLEVADEHLAAVKKHMGSRGDISGIYGAVRQEAGMKFEN